MMDWKSFGDDWRRASSVVPGYDCRVECKHAHKGDHGIHNDEWIYVVSNGESAVSLRVGSHVYPPTVLHVDPEPPRGWDLELHVPWTTDTEKIREGTRGSECSFVEAGRCFAEASSFLDGKVLFAQHGVPAFDQPESFWEALREKAKEWIERARKDRERTQHLRQCSACQGRGVVEIVDA